jgi:Protein of unknown function (DUF2909)
MGLIRIGVFLVLAAIVASLGVALFHLASNRGSSDKLLRSLTIRVVLSVVLFLLLMIAWRFGLIRPHGLGR